MTAEEIIDHFPDTRQGEQLIMGRIDRRIRRTLCVEYYFELYPRDAQKPLSPYLIELEMEGFRGLPFPYDDADEAIETWRDYSNHFGAIPDQDMETYLRNGVPRGSACSLIIIPVVITNM